MNWKIVVIISLVRSCCKAQAIWSTGFIALCLIDVGLSAEAGGNTGVKQQRD